MTLNQIKKRLKQQLGTISPSDQYHYELLIDSWDTYLRAGEDIKQGVVITSGTRLFVNPAVAVRNEAHKQIIKLCKIFGITPVCRDGGTEIDEEMTALIEGD